MDSCGNAFCDEDANHILYYVMRDNLFDGWLNIFVLSTISPCAGMLFEGYLYDANFLLSYRWPLPHYHVECSSRNKLYVFWYISLFLIIAAYDLNMEQSMAEYERPDVFSSFFSADNPDGVYYTTSFTEVCPISKVMHLANSYAAVLQWKDCKYL